MKREPKSPPPNAVELLGKSFGWLTVVAISADRKHLGRQHWRCQCVCGKVVVLPTNNLTSGNSRSCGCLKSLLPAARRIVAKVGKQATQIGGREGNDIIRAAIAADRRSAAVKRHDLLLKLIVYQSNGVPLEAMPRPELRGVPLGADPSDVHKAEFDRRRHGRNPASSDATYHG